MTPYFAVSLVAISCIVYHSCQKSVGNFVNPFALLAGAYATALVATVGLLCVLHRGSAGQIFVATFKTPAPLILGLAVLGVEAGFLFAYRTGWPISTASVVANSASA